MATAKKTPAKTADKPEEMGARAPKQDLGGEHPDVDKSRTADEVNTTGAAVQPNDEGAAPVGTRLHMIGANADPKAESPQPGSAPFGVDELAEQEHVYSHAAAMALPEVDSGSPMKAPSPEAIEADQKTAEKDAQDKQRERNKDLESKERIDPETVKVAKRTPVTAFKDEDGRTMLVVKGKGGLGKMAAKVRPQEEA